MKEVILGNLLDAAKEERKGVSRLIFLYCTVAVILFAAAGFQSQSGNTQRSINIGGEIFYISPEVTGWVFNVGLSIVATFLVGFALYAGNREITNARERENRLILNARELVGNDVCLKDSIDNMQSVREISRNGRIAIIVASIVTWLALIYAFLCDK